MTIAQHILVPTDFSDASKHGYEAAATLAGLDHSHVTLAHVYDPTPLARDPNGLGEQSDGLYQHPEVEAEIYDALTSARETWFANIKNVRMRHVLSSNAVKAITELATEIGADLIVLPTHGRTGMAKAMIGSVAEAVVRLAPCPVLVVRP